MSSGSTRAGASRPNGSPTTRGYRLGREPGRAVHPHILRRGLDVACALLAAYGLPGADVAVRCALTSLQ
jgi:hypothetical protein